MALKIDELVFDKLAEVLKKHNLTEVEYKYGDTKIRLSSNNFSQNSAPIIQQRTVIEESANVVEKKEQKETDYNTHPGAVKSPMVGTCYMASEPGARPFIALGDSVQEGQPLLIIEAMKVMNLIKSPKAGKVIHIAVSNSEPIEFGQLLVVIE
ncbi:MAG: acetyl-CoA carboxylase biotin carboxyl carrier protein subunit [Alphaproteobacteria bacterium]|nr:acetyl-CoA carboxylase biotin carboxyl carrier protein subunit [Alphaproteobacteria bacterium]